MLRYHQEVQHFADWCDRQRSETKGLASTSRSPTKPFIPRDATIKYIERRASRLMDAIYDYDRREIPSIQDVKQDCALVLAILLSIDRGPFIAYFVQHETLHDKNLPFLQRPLKFWRDANDDFFGKFYNAQWQFCAHVFKPSYGALREIPPEIILPVTELAEIDQRPSSIISKITIHHGHDGLLGDQGASYSDRSTRPHVYVMKTYRSRDAQNLCESEVEAYKHIIAARAYRNFIGFYGGIKHGDTYSIILEYADKGTLDMFLSRAEPPHQPEEILEFWRSMSQLLEGLAGLHGITPNESLEFPAARGWHQDIKPSNILALSHESVRACDTQFRICDLGLSHFRLHGTTAATDEDSDVGGTREYGAPECCRAHGVPPDIDRGVGQSVDVWSLGCVWLEAACWLLESWKDLDNFRQQRRRQTQRLSYRHSDIGCFHDGSQILPCVKQMIDDLERSASRNGDDLTISILEQIRSMLVPAHDRPKSHDLVLSVRDLLRKDPITPSAHSRRSTHTHPGRESYGSSISKHTSSGQNHFYETEMSPATTMSSPPERISSQTNPRGLQEEPSEIPNWPQRDAWEWYTRRKKSRSGSHLAPSEFQHHLSEMGPRDVVFLVDDVMSMTHHWQSVINTVKLLAYLVKLNDKNGMDLYFSTSPREPAAHSKNSSALAEEVSKRGLKTARSSEIHFALEHILEGTLTKMRRYGQSRTSLAARMHRLPKPLVIYVLTDGAWPAHCDLRRPINTLVQTMKQNEFPVGYVGIEFVSFGNNPGGLARMQELDDHADWSEQDVVDTEPHDGNVIKMLFGGIHKGLDTIPQSPPSSATQHDFWDDTRR